MHRSKVLKIIDETEDTKSILFEKPQGFSYYPGQYGIFDHKSGDEIIRRSYSFSSSPTESFLQITVKHMSQGRMSGYLTMQLHELEFLEYNAPVGKFFFEDSLKDVVFIAGGSGISPFRGMTKYILDKQLTTNATLVYGSRSPKDIILRNFFEECNAKYNNFKLFLTIDIPDNNWCFHSGFIDANFIKEATKSELANKDFFICGPPPMVNAVKKTLSQLGIIEEKIRIDAWG